MSLKNIKNYLRLLWAWKWLYPMIKRHEHRFFVFEDCLRLCKNDLDLGNLQIAWEITLTKWYLLYLSYYGLDNGGYGTCGLCRYTVINDSYVCEICPVKRCDITPFTAYLNAPSRENALAELVHLIRIYESTRGLDEFEYKNFGSGAESEELDEIESALQQGQ